MITGYLTTAGEQIVAKKLLNGTPYTLVGVNGGDGNTPLSSDYQLNNKHTLTLGTPYTENGVSVLPVTLIMSAVSASYNLKELGVVVNTEGSHRLFKLFKLSEPINIDKSQPHTIQFLLRDVDISGADSAINIVPDTAVTLELLNHTIQALHSVVTEKVNLSMPGEELSPYLKTLPDYIDKHYIIKLSNSRCHTALSLKNKFGPGSITISGDYKNTDAVSDRARLSAEVTINNCHLQGLTFSLFDCDATAAITNVSIHTITDSNPICYDRCKLTNTTDSHIIRVTNSKVTFFNSTFFYRNGRPTLRFAKHSQGIFDYNPTTMASDPMFPSGSSWYYLEAFDNSFLSFVGGCGEGHLSACMKEFKSSGYCIRPSVSSPIAEVRIY